MNHSITRVPAVSEQSVYVAYRVVAVRCSIQTVTYFYMNRSVTSVLLLVNNNNNAYIFCSTFPR